MEKELLIINGGNTHVELLTLSSAGMLDWQDPGEEKKKILSHEEFFQQWDILSGGKKVAASSVVPKLTSFLASKNVFLVNKEKRHPFLTGKIDINTVGGDRLANAAALCSMGQLPAICIDFGTAITFEVVEKDGSFTGGAILPGRKLMRYALHDHTGLLPLIPLASSPEELPAGPGKNTCEAMLLGTDLACIGAVKEILDQIKNDLESKYPNEKICLYGCGGDRRFFLSRLPGIKDTPLLTLQGVFRYFQENEGEKEK